MSNNMNEKQLIAGIKIAMTAGTVSVPHLLLQYYHRLNLSETDVMVLIHLIDFKEKEQKDFPTLDEIGARMSARPDDIIASLQKLMKSDMIRIDERVDPISGIRSEAYNVTFVYDKLAACRIQDASPPDEDGNAANQEKKDIFTIIEKEFARLLSPMECEMISGWLDKDEYPEELILAALKEAVFAGKVHFRYIDRILLEWKRNRVFNADDAKEYARKFRGDR